MKEKTHDKGLWGELNEETEIGFFIGSRVSSFGLKYIRTSFDAYL
jgi:hypothetical protein